MLSKQATSRIMVRAKPVRRHKAPRSRAVARRGNIVDNAREVIPDSLTEMLGTGDGH